MEARAKIVKTAMDDVPRCPHCSADLSDCTVTVADLLTHYPFGGWLAVGHDGYAREEEHLTTNCQECHKPVVIGFNSDPERWLTWQAKFGAARTKRDEEFLNPDSTGRFFDKAVRIQEAIHCGESS